MPRRSLSPSCGEAVKNCWTGFMPEVDTAQLVALLSRQELRIRTGILELPLQAVGHEHDLAVNLSIGHCDLCTWKANSLPTGRTRLGVHWEVLANDVLAVAADDSLPGYS